ncbi:MAG: hypothetical protein KatS3mg102_2364 [Planctomycetota bacterium]|nr:MAG: hypothetical protein KatS3mg102_2364 [Planctomycetota bacterium]
MSAQRPSPGARAAAAAATGAKEGGAGAGTKPAAAPAQDLTLEESFARMQEAMQKRLQTRERLLRVFRNLQETTILTLRKFNVFSVEEWDGGFAFEIGDFAVVLQLAEFDDGRLWPITVWMRHDDVEVWKRIDEGDFALSADAEDRIVFASTGYSPEDFLRVGLFPRLTQAVQSYTVTEQDVEEGWTDEELFED